MTSALGITFFPVSTGRTSKPVPLFDHGFLFFFAFWPLHRLTIGGGFVHQAEVEHGCKFIFQRCDPNVFVTLALVLLHPCQLYPDGTAIFLPQDKNKTWSFLLVAHFLSLRDMGGTGSLFGAASELPEPARSSFLCSCRGFGFCGVHIRTFVTQLGSFVLGTSTMKRTPILKYFL